MTIVLPKTSLEIIEAQGEASYPDETAGLLIGRVEKDTRVVVSVLPLANTFSKEEKHHRYLLSPEDMLRAEEEAEARGLDILAVYHSHPDHPAVPSEFDREWALPWFVYIITQIDSGSAVMSRAWRLSEDRQEFIEETLQHEESQEQGGPK